MSVLWTEKHVCLFFFSLPFKSPRSDYHLLLAEDMSYVKVGRK